MLIAFLRIVVWHMSVHSLATGHVVRVCIDDWFVKPTVDQLHV